MCNYIPYNKKITSIKKLDYERNPMKKIFAFLTMVSFITILLLFVQNRSKRQNSFDWNYTGTGVILSNSEPFEYKGITDITLDGTVYENGKSFFGDLRIGTVEETRRYKGNINSKYYKFTGVMSLYRYLLLTEGEEYLNNKTNREHHTIEVEPAWLDSIGTKAEKIKMFPFSWFEWYEYANQEGNIKRAPWMQTGGLYFIKAGENFIIRTVSDFIVPGATKKEEAIEFIKKNFEELLD